MTDLLINTLESPGEFDALTTLRPGEPYFLLCGRDRLAPDLVKTWAKTNRTRALDEFDAGEIDEDKRDRELRKSTQAEAIGWAMTSYKAGHEAKRVKETGERSTYSGHETSDEVRNRERIHRQRLDAKAALNNAVAELNDLVQLVGESDDAETADMVNIARDLVEDMRNMSALVTPKRPGIA